MTDWSIADIWEVVARDRPAALAVTQGDRCLSWSDFDRRADGVAAALVDRGLARQAKVAQYLYNAPEYVESVFAAWKASLVPVNTNYRYTHDELLYLWDNADVEAVVFHATFTERVEAIRGRLPRVQAWLWVDDGSGPCPDWALPYEQAANSGERFTDSPRWARSGDDLLLVYTGGTTGMPKGVMWRVDDIFSLMNRAAALRYDEQGTLDDVAAMLAAQSEAKRPVVMPGPPLMHATALLTTNSGLTSGGCVVMTKGRTFDAEEMLDVIVREGVTQVSIVGDAFARPIVAALDAQPDRWDLSRLKMIVSSGVIWSTETKQALLRHAPGLMLTDVLGSSEAVGVANSVSSAKTGVSETAAFVPGPNAKVIREDGTEIVPGSGEVGMLATRGRGPIGYYKDPEKSAATFRVIDGDRWTVAGDFATIDADGVLVLLGRGSVCINTGGEKVFPEEVEEALKRFEGVYDAVVVGVPDERFGEAVTALVELRGVDSIDTDALIAFTRTTLAAYKTPKRVYVIDSIGRAPNGKVDYKRLRDEAVARLAGRRYSVASDTG